MCRVDCVYSTLMRVQIYLPDEIAVTVRKQDLNVSRICREALLVAARVCPTCGQSYEGEKSQEEQSRQVELPKPVRRVVRGERTGRIGGVTRRRG